jgi:NUMOD4 motif/HNH endonuclease
MLIIKEIWKDIRGYEGLYQVSNHGRIKHIKKNRLLKLINRGSGYLCVTLSKNNCKKIKYVHLLVGFSFVKGYKKGLQINHKDGNKLNNNCWNLQWVTAKENIIHAFKNKLNEGNRREKNGQCKLTEKQVKEIKSLEGKFTQKEIAIKFGVVQQTISYVLKN